MMRIPGVHGGTFESRTHIPTADSVHNGTRTGHMTVVFHMETVRHFRRHE